MIRIYFAVVVAIAPANAFAWNAVGHKVIADIAWQELDEGQRAEIVRMLRRHPRFDADFARAMPAEDQDRWIFQHAATWTDQIRGNRDYDEPTWHYVNFPLFVGGERPVTFNRATTVAGHHAQWNVIQAVAHVQEVLASDKPPNSKALAYCWLFHLVGDLHQPLHSTSLVCDRFPNGDRGGNSIPLVQGRNLHSLWDNLLGRQSRLLDVDREVAELKALTDGWDVDLSLDVPCWVEESHDLCKSFAYSPEITDAVQRPGELERIRLPESYLESAGEKARLRVVAAGLRLATILKATSQPRFTPFDELAKLPVGINVSHDPEAPSARLADPKIFRAKYVWDFGTTVSSIDGDVRIVEFGTFSRRGNIWMHGATLTGRPYGPKEFAEWYSCPEAVLKGGTLYSDPKNWSSSNRLSIGIQRWYFVGIDAKGQKVKGDASINLQPLLK